MNPDDVMLGVVVQSILLVEDSIRYYSTYLPAIYKLVLQQSAEFLKEALNEQQQMLRKRGLPKILLATNYEESVMLYERYKLNLLGVISDVGFVLHKNDPADREKLDAGIDLCRLIKSDDPHMPFLLQSSQESMRKTAEELGVGFVVKYSKTLLIELSDYISEEFAFGDFVFRDPGSGEVIGRARDLRDMQRLVQEIPEEVLLYYTSRRVCSNPFPRAIFRRWTGSASSLPKRLPNTASYRGTAWSRISTRRPITATSGLPVSVRGRWGERPEDWPSSTICCSVTTSTINTRESK